MMESVLLYHWSPTSRRKGITRYGLVPGKWSTDRLWKPPFVCFGDSPSWAWAMSGEMRPEVPAWDLWCVWTDRLNGYEELPDWDGGVHEYRVYERIRKRDVWFVGTRAHDGERARA